MLSVAMECLPLYSTLGCHGVTQICSGYWYYAVSLLASAFSKLKEPADISHGILLLGDATD